MSTAVETPELDAAIAEAELTDDEAVKVRELVEQGGQITSAVAFVVSEREPDEPEAPAAPAAEPASGEPTKKQLDALDKELTRHEARVHEIMGPFVAGFVACEACGSVGLVAPGDPPPTPQPHEWFRSCETCAGFGQVLTGSHRDGQQARDCPACKGRGYLEALDAQGAPLADQTSAVAAGAVTPPPAPPATTETAPPGELSFGTPAWMGNPTIGQ